jgi:hypothetical protein
MKTVHDKIKLSELIAETEEELRRVTGLDMNDINLETDPLAEVLQLQSANSGIISINFALEIIESCKLAYESVKERMLTGRRTLELYNSHVNSSAVPSSIKILVDGIVKDIGEIYGACRYGGAFSSLLSVNVGNFDEPRTVPASEDVMKLEMPGEVKVDSSYDFREKIKELDENIHKLDRFMTSLGDFKNFQQKRSKQRSESQQSKMTSEANRLVEKLCALREQLVVVDVFHGTCSRKEGHCCGDHIVAPDMDADTGYGEDDADKEYVASVNAYLNPQKLLEEAIQKQKAADAKKEKIRQAKEDGFHGFTVVGDDKEVDVKIEEECDEADTNGQTSDEYYALKYGFNGRTIDQDPSAGNWQGLSLEEAAIKEYQDYKDNGVTEIVTVDSYTESEQALLYYADKYGIDGRTQEGNPDFDDTDAQIIHEMNVLDAMSSLIGVPVLPDGETLSDQAASFYASHYGFIGITQTEDEGAEKAARREYRTQDSKGKVKSQGDEYYQGLAEAAGFDGRTYSGYAYNAYNVVYEWQDALYPKSSDLYYANHSGFDGSTQGDDETEDNAKIREWQAANTSKLAASDYYNFVKGTKQNFDGRTIVKDQSEEEKIVAEYNNAEGKSGPLYYANHYGFDGRTINKDPSAGDWDGLTQEEAKEKEVEDADPRGVKNNQAALYYAGKYGIDGRTQNGNPVFDDADAQIIHEMNVLDAKSSLGGVPVLPDGETLSDQAALFYAEHYGYNGRTKTDGESDDDAKIREFKDNDTEGKNVGQANTYYDKLEETALKEEFIKATTAGFNGNRYTIYSHLINFIVFLHLDDTASQEEQMAMAIAEGFTVSTAYEAFTEDVKEKNLALLGATKVLEDAYDNGSQDLIQDAHQQVINAGLDQDSAKQDEVDAIRQGAANAAAAVAVAFDQSVPEGLQQKISDAIENILKQITYQENLTDAKFKDIQTAVLEAASAVGSDLKTKITENMKNNAFYVAASGLSTQKIIARLRQTNYDETLTRFNTDTSNQIAKDKAIEQYMVRKADDPYRLSIKYYMNTKPPNAILPAIDFSEVEKLITDVGVKQLGFDGKTGITALEEYTAATAAGQTATQYYATAAALAAAAAAAANGNIAKSDAIKNDKKHITAIILNELQGNYNSLTVKSMTAYILKYLDDNMGTFPENIQFVRHLFNVDKDKTDMINIINQYREAAGKTSNLYYAEKSGFDGSTQGDDETEDNAKIREWQAANTSKLAASDYYNFVKGTKQNFDGRTIVKDQSEEEKIVAEYNNAEGKSGPLYYANHYGFDGRTIDQDPSAGDWDGLTQEEATEKEVEDADPRGVINNQAALYYAGKYGIDGRTQNGNPEFDDADADAQIIHEMNVLDAKSSLDGVPVLPDGETLSDQAALFYANHYELNARTKTDDETRDEAKIREYRAADAKGDKPSEGPRYYETLAKAAGFDGRTITGSDTNAAEEMNLAMNTGLWDASVDSELYYAHDAGLFKGQINELTTEQKQEAKNNYTLCRSIKGLQVKDYAVYMKAKANKFDGRTIVKNVPDHQKMILEQEELSVLPSLSYYANFYKFDGRTIDMDKTDGDWNGLTEIEAKEKEVELAKPQGVDADQAALYYAGKYGIDGRTQNGNPHFETIDAQKISEIVKDKKTLLIGVPVFPNDDQELSDQAALFYATEYGFDGTTITGNETVNDAKRREYRAAGKPTGKVDSKEEDYYLTLATGAGFAIYYDENNPTQLEKSSAIENWKTFMGVTRKAELNAQQEVEDAKQEYYEYRLGRAKDKEDADRLDEAHKSMMAELKVIDDQQKTEKQEEAEEKANAKQNQEAHAAELAQRALDLKHQEIMAAAVEKAEEEAAGIRDDAAAKNKAEADIVAQIAAQVAAADIIADAKAEKASILKKIADAEAMRKAKIAQTEEEAAKELLEKRKSALNDVPPLSYPLNSDKYNYQIREDAIASIRAADSLEKVADALKNAIDANDAHEAEKAKTTKKASDDQDEVKRVKEAQEQLESMQEEEAKAAKNAAAVAALDVAVEAGFTGDNAVSNFEYAQEFTPPLTSDEFTILSKIATADATLDGEDYDKITTNRIHKFVNNKYTEAVKTYNNLKGEITDLITKNSQEAQSYNQLTENSTKFIEKVYAEIERIEVGRDSDLKAARTVVSNGIDKTAETIKAYEKELNDAVASINAGSDPKILKDDYKLSDIKIPNEIDVSGTEKALQYFQTTWSEYTRTKIDTYDNQKQWTDSNNVSWPDYYASFKDAWNTEQISKKAEFDEEIVTAEGNKTDAKVIVSTSQGELETKTVTLTQKNIELQNKQNEKVIIETEEAEEAEEAAEGGAGEGETPGENTLALAETEGAGLFLEVVAEITEGTQNQQVSDKLQTVLDAIAALNTEIDTLNTDISTLNENISEANTQITASDTKITELQEKKEALADEVFKTSPLTNENAEFKNKNAWEEALKAAALPADKPADANEPNENVLSEPKYRQENTWDTERAKAELAFVIASVLDITDVKTALGKLTNLTNDIMKQKQVLDKNTNSEKIEETMISELLDSIKSHQVIIGKYKLESDRRNKIVAKYTYFKGLLEAKITVVGDFSTSIPYDAGLPVVNAVEIAMTEIREQAKANDNLIGEYSSAYSTVVGQINELVKEIKDPDVFEGTNPSAGDITDMSNKYSVQEILTNLAKTGDDGSTILDSLSEYFASDHKHNTQETA